VRLIGEIPKGGDDLVAGRDRGNIDQPRRNYVRDYNTDNAYQYDMQFQRNYQVHSGQYGPRPYYYYQQQQPNPYYERRYDNGRGLFQPWGR